MATLHRDTRYRRLLAGADLLSVATATYVAVELLGRSDSLRLTAVVVLPIVVLIAKAVGLYDRDEHLLTKTTIDEVPALFQVASFAALSVWLAEPVFVDGEVGRDQMAGLLGLLFVGMITARTAVRRLAKATTQPERCLVLGDADDASWLHGKLKASNGTAAEVVGRVVLHDEAGQNGHGPPPLGTIDTLGLVLADAEVDRLIITPSVSGPEEILEATRLSRSLGVKVSLLPRLFGVVGSAVEVDNVDGLMLLGLRSESLSKSSRALKRGLDLVGSAVGLVVLAPLFAWIALAVKLTSPGPVFFTQKRIGRWNREFQMIKFRTMVDGADDGKAALRELNEADGLFKMADDPRVTRVGSFLRRSSLDELPQLFNVLRGQMSLAGPRPLVPDEDRMVTGFDRRRLGMLPGMTGAWQVYGSSRIPLHEMVKIDYIYAANWSLWLDAKILLRTVPYALRRRGV